MALISAQTTVGYSDALPRPRLIVVYEPVLAYNPEIIKIRVYPWRPDKIVASGGTVRIAGNKIQRVESEVVTFEGTDTAVPVLPITGGFAWRSLDTIFDSNGALIYPEFSADIETGNVRCDASVLGAVEIDYDAGYTIADYIPGARFKTLALDAVWIAAIKGGSIERLAIDSSVLGDYLDFVELYSVTSDVVINIDGRWEKPQNWPDNPTYSPLNTIPPDPDESVVEARTHDRGVIDNKGRLQFDRPWAPYEKPYVSDLSYKPAWEYKQGTPPTGYESAFRDFDFDSLKTDLAKRYPGITGL